MIRKQLKKKKTEERIERKKEGKKNANLELFSQICHGRVIGFPPLKEAWR